MVIGNRVMHLVERGGGVKVLFILKGFGVFPSKEAYWYYCRGVESNTNWMGVGQVNRKWVN